MLGDAALLATTTKVFFRTPSFDDLSLFQTYSPFSRAISGFSVVDKLRKPRKVNSQVHIAKSERRNAIFAVTLRSGNDIAVWLSGNHPL
jgi:hypothetical protein